MQGSQQVCQISKYSTGQGRLEDTKKTNLIFHIVQVHFSEIQKPNVMTSAEKGKVSKQHKNLPSE